MFVKCPFIENHHASIIQHTISHLLKSTLHCHPWILPMSPSRFLPCFDITDGSETTEDQQLLDRDCGTGEYPPMMDSGAQLGYGTFYDHASGYYYEYPVMLVGPAPVPAQVPPSVLAAVPCEPVPLRPIEWINPAFVPKLAGQPYCVMDYPVCVSILLSLQLYRS